MTHKIKLGELPATAICRNDITSSCPYVSALTVVYAGQYEWIALIIVALVLFLFRKIYNEVVGALPLNGGAYNVLLNTTSKSNASDATCLTILSYMVTAGISATEAMQYLHSLVRFVNLTTATLRQRKNPPGIPRGFPAVFIPAIVLLILMLNRIAVLKALLVIFDIFFTIARRLSLIS